jgi:uncharacterized protein with PhoU and TrkA domain
MHIDDQIEEKALKDGSYAIAYALLQVARSQKEVAVALRNLDVAFVGERIEAAAGSIADAVREAAD